MPSKKRGGGTRAPRVLVRKHEGVERRSVVELAMPGERPLKAFAFDPSRGRLLGNQMSLSIPYEEIDPGPVTRDPYAYDAIAVIDYDATNDVFYEPVNLDDPRVMLSGGLAPTESDPRFHQQMVYAIITDTVRHFEAALGRRIHWRRVSKAHAGKAGARDQNIFTLNVFPHALEAENAFYSPRAHGLLFGYFRARDKDQGESLPGQIVYTCLSHDIVVHETTHAIIDGIRGYFTEQTNPDVAAFHEGFADIVALFRHFAHQEVLLDTIQRTGGALFEARLAADAPLAAGQRPVIGAQIPGRNPLIELAKQFGEATGRGAALRSALGAEPKPDDIHIKLEPHARGAILVAAIFDAYFTVYQRRTADLFRIHRHGGGSAGADIPQPLARLLAQEASRLAQLFFKVCVRALDYCPPIDITFGDFLRAVVTSDFDLHPEDDDGLRDALMQAFRVRGIVPDGSSFFTDTAIAWPPATGLSLVENLVFDDPNGLTREQQDACRPVLQAYVDVPAHRRALGLDASLPVDVPSFHPVFRIAADGSLRTDMVVEVVQQRQAHFDPGRPEMGGFPICGGATIIISKPPLAELRRRALAHESINYGRIAYVIGKPLHGEVGKAREARQRDHLERAGLVEGDDPDRFHIDFALTHGGL